MIIVFGSINRDFIFSTDHLPTPGETVLCNDYDISTGGKGSNQALAASRFGDRVALVGKVGDDNIGMNVLNTIRREGVMTSGVAQSEDLPTGCAAVIHDKNGENQIAMTPGANIETKAEQVPDEILNENTFILMQMEVNPAQNIELSKRAKEFGSKTILNLAPAQNISKDLLKNIDYLITNEIEFNQLAVFLGYDTSTGIEKINKEISEKEQLCSIITLAEKGSIAHLKDGTSIKIPALKLDKVIDTTGAGDAFCGTLTACLYKDISIEESMKRASIAGSLACMNKGIQDSFVYLNDIEEHLENLPS
jgi:ribokinase